MMLFTFTMIFNAGMIPNYVLMKDLHLLDTRWVMILPGGDLRLQYDHRQDLLLHQHPPGTAGGGPDGRMQRFQVPRLNRHPAFQSDPGGAGDVLRDGALEQLF